MSLKPVSGSPLTTKNQQLYKDMDYCFALGNIIIEFALIDPLLLMEIIPDAYNK